MPEQASAGGSLNAVGNSAQMGVVGYAGVAIQLTETWVGTVLFQATVDGSTWVSVNGLPPDSTTPASSATATGVWVFSAAGFKSIRAYCSAFSSGPIGVTLRADTAAPGTSSSGATSGGGAVTIADGADVAEGATTDAKVTGDNSGTEAAKLRGLSYLWALVIDTANSWVKVSIQNASLAVTQSGSWILSAGTALIGKVGIDQTTPGTTNNVTVDTSTGAGATLGATTGAAVVTDANGTIQQYLRGLVKLAITAGSFLVTAALSAGTNVIGGVRRAGYQNAIWATSHFPAANTQATITRATAGGGVKNVALGFTATLCGGATAPTAIQLTVKLIDGASGGGTILWGTVIALPAVAGATVAIVRSGIYIPGTANTAMTLEFSVAGGANTIESVSLEGTTE
jgi:hypothetical protein